MTSVIRNVIPNRMENRNYYTTHEFDAEYDCGHFAVPIMSFHAKFVT